MSDELEQEESEVSEEIVREARDMGWRPLEEFKGDKDRWVDAEEFIEKGRHVLPIVQQNNKRLTQQLADKDRRLAAVEQALSISTRAIDKLEKHYTEANKRSVENAKIQLRERLRDARENQDIDSELEVQEEIEALRVRQAAIEEEEGVVDKPPVKQGYAPPPPDIQAWYDENPWFGGDSTADKKRTKEILRLAEDLREEGETETGRKFFEKVVEEFESRNAGKNKRDSTDDEPARSGRVEGGSPRSTSTSGASFASLPAEARKACHEDADDLVGEGKRYKTLQDWEKAYTKIYRSM